MTPTLRRMLWWGRQTLLTVGAALGAACLVVAAASALFDVRPLVFESGSMAPTITTGALALSHDVAASELEVGDVVSVPTGSGERVTHRIVTVTHRGDLASLALQGDANQAPDARTYEVSHADRVLFDIPLLGYAIGWLVGPVGLFLLGLYAAFLLSVIVKRTPEDPRPGSSTGHNGAKLSTGHSGAKHKMVATGLSVVIMSGAAATLVLERQTTPTLAAFADAGSVSGTQLTAALPAPSGLVCVKGNGQRVTLTWAAVTGATYVVYDDGVAIPQATLSYSTANKDLGVLWVVATRSFSGQPWTSAESVHYSYTKTVCVPS